MDCDTQIRIFGYKKCQMKENRNNFEFLGTPESIIRCHAGFQESRSPFLNFLEVWCMNEASWLASFPPRDLDLVNSFCRLFFTPRSYFLVNTLGDIRSETGCCCCFDEKKKKFRGHFWWQHSIHTSEIRSLYTLILNTSKSDKFL